MIFAKYLIYYNYNLGYNLYVMLSTSRPPFWWYIFLYVCISVATNHLFCDSSRFRFDSTKDDCIRVNNRLTRLFLDSKIQIRIDTFRVQNDSNDSITRNRVQTRVKWLNFCTRVSIYTIIIRTKYNTNQCIFFKYNNLKPMRR